MTHEMFLTDEADSWGSLVSSAVKFRNTQFGKLYLLLEDGSIVLQQKWKYTWLVVNGAKPWTDDEQRDFHYAVQSQIWTAWNSKRPVPQVQGDPATQQIIALLNQHNGLSFSVTGTSEFARKFGALGVPMEFEVLLTTKHPHWHIKVRKDTKPFRAFVDWNAMTVNLAFTDTAPDAATQTGPKGASTPNFLAIPHEFGHTLFADDEYDKPWAKNYADLKSIMNIGNEVRPRHLKFINAQLNTLLPGTRFSLPSA